MPALGNSSLGYILSAVVGIGLVALLAWLFAAVGRPRNSGARLAGPKLAVTTGRRAADAQAAAEARRGVLEGTLGEISHALERSLFAEDMARQPGLLQSLDPRTKIVTTLALLIAVALSRNAWVIAGVYRAGAGSGRRVGHPDGFFCQAGVAVHAVLHRHHRAAGAVHHARPGAGGGCRWGSSSPAPAR